MEDPDAYSELDSTIQGLYSNEKNAFHLILQKLQKHSKIQAKTLKRLYKLEEQHEQDTLEIAELKKEVQCLSYNLSPDSFAEPVEEKAVAVAVAVTPTPTPVLATPTTLENVPLLKEQIDYDEAAEPPFVAAPAPVSTPTKAPPPNNKQEALLVAPIAPLSPAPSSPKSNQKRRSTVNVSKNKLDVAMTMTRRLDQLEAGQVGFKQTILDEMARLIQGLRDRSATPISGSPMQNSVSSAGRSPSPFQPVSKIEIGNNDDTNYNDGSHTELRQTMESMEKRMRTIEIFFHGYDVMMAAAKERMWKLEEKQIELEEEEEHQHEQLAEIEKKQEQITMVQNNAHHGLIFQQFEDQKRMKGDIENLKKALQDLLKQKQRQSPLLAKRKVTREVSAPTATATEKAATATAPTPTPPPITNTDPETETETEIETQDVQPEISPTPISEFSDEDDDLTNIINDITQLKKITQQLKVSVDSKLPTKIHSESQIETLENLAEIDVQLTLLATTKLEKSLFSEELAKYEESILKKMKEAATQQSPETDTTPTTKTTTTENRGESALEFKIRELGDRVGTNKLNLDKLAGELHDSVLKLKEDSVSRDFVEKQLKLETLQTKEKLQMQMRTDMVDVNVKIGVLSKELGEKPDQESIGDMLKELESTLAARFGDSRTIQIILENLKLDLRKKTTKNDVMGLMSKVMDDIQNKMALPDDNLMAGHIPYRCLCCNGSNSGSGGMHKTPAKRIVHNKMALVSSTFANPTRSQMVEEGVVLAMYPHGRGGALRPLGLGGTPGVPREGGGNGNGHSNNRHENGRPSTRG